jgi:hypothetical protein
MATHDYVIANQSGAAFRTDLNNALAAIVSNNSNSSEPATKYAYQWWADTNDGVLKIRNSSNDGWVTLLQLDGTLTLEDGTNSAPALGFRDDLNTGIFSSAADTLDITCGGTTRGSFSSSGLAVTGNVTATTFVGNIDAVDGDFDGTLEADAITVAGVALATVIAGTTVTTATNANHISVADNESTNENNLIPFIEDASATGNVGLESDGDFTYNPSTGTLTATLLAGTLTTTNQTNIATLGTLTDLTVSGDVLFTGTSANILFDKSENTLEFKDNAIAAFGDSDDFTIQHLSSDSTTRLIETSGGSLFIQAGNFVVTNPAGNEFMINGAPDGGLDLYHNGVKKFETESGGVSLTGGAAANVTALSDGSTITIDMATACHHSVTLGGNRTFAAPSNQAVGQSGSIFITQDGTGSRTASFNSAFKFVGGTAPTLSTAAAAVDRIDYVILSSNVIHCAVSLDVK